jgi:glycerate dehydrogenase
MPEKPLCRFLDRASLDRDDMDFSAIEAMTRFESLDQTRPQELTEHAGEAEILIANKVCFGTTEFRALPKLQLLCVIATGVNNVDLDAASDAGIPVVNVRDYAAAAVSQHVFLLMLALMTRFRDYQQAIDTGRWQSQEQFCLLDYPMRELSGKTLGLVGYGHIARSVERIARAFGMEILVAESLRPGASVSPGRIPLLDLLSAADVISLHCPLSGYSRGLIGSEELRLMKPDALLINTARGGIIDESALLTALRTGAIGGAGIDCLEQEPPAPDHPLINAGLSNLIITPHNAWGTREARQRLVDGTADNIRRFLAGRELPNRVNT